ncbi:MAG TPA: T3SS effector HopA1 family protein, partial [Acidimicrobiales bacterium]|nr:T3SS effector HopA1 family protein [Acidimicrobiales bacterium]
MTFNRTYLRSVEAVLEVIEIHPPTAYSWFGQRVDEVPGRTARAMDDATARRYLANTIQWHLYRDFYCKGAATPSLERDRYDADRSARFSPFVQALSQANTGRGSSEPGWVLRDHDEGQLVVERHGLAVWVEPADVVGGGDGDSGLRPGAPVLVRLPNELRRLSPGFYVALGDKGLPPDDAEPLVRLYWNLRSSAASRLVARGTDLLNQSGIAFQLKVADHPDHYDRCDAGVVYVTRRDYPDVAPLVASLHRELAAGLEPS